jgi:exonuclease SbcD
VPLPGSSTVLRYSGSPVAYSFSERDHTKSVALVELGADGVIEVRRQPTPVARALREVRGALDDLLARAEGDLAELADCYVKVVLTDQVRPLLPMERLRRHWPHTLELGYEPQGGLIDPASDLARLERVRDDPVAVCGQFVEFVGGAAPDPDEQRVLRDTIEAAESAAVVA